MGGIMAKQIYALDAAARPILDDMLFLGRLIPGDTEDRTAQSGLAIDKGTLTREEAWRYASGQNIEVSDDAAHI
jgi:hypothetical protein